MKRDALDQALSRRRLVRLLLLVVVPLIVVLTGTYLYVRGGREVETENAYVKADVLAVSAEVSGRGRRSRWCGTIRRSPRGALLFRLDPTPFEIAVSKARAQMDVVRTDVQSLRAEYRATLRRGSRGARSASNSSRDSCSARRC